MVPQPSACGNHRTGSDPSNTALSLNRHEFSSTYPQTLRRDGGYQPTITGHALYAASMSDTDSPADSSGDASPAQTAEQTSASDQASAPATEPSQSPPSGTDGEGKTSYQERINGLMSSLGRKEQEKQAAIRDRDEAQAALTALQATYESHDQRQSQAAPAQTPAAQAEPSAPVAPTETPAPDPPAVFAPTSPSRAYTAVSGTPRMSEADRALEQLQQSFDNHMRLLNNRH